MNCDDCLRRLQARLDGESVGGDEVEAHLALCPECRALEAAAHRLEAGLRLLTPPATPEGMGQRIAVGVLADRRRRRIRRRLVFVGAVAAAAASLLLGLFLGSGQDGLNGWASLKNFVFPRPSIHIEVVDVPGRSDNPPPAVPPAPSLNDNAEATSAVASLARRTADETVSNGQLLVPSVSLPMPQEDDLTPPLDPPAQSLREAGQGVATGLEPVANSARRAFDLFRRDLPPVAPDANSGL